MKPIARVLLTVLLMGSVLLYVWERVEIVRLGYHVERLKTKRVVLQRERDELQVKLSALSAPDRLARVATDRLGLVPPRQGQVVLVAVKPGSAPTHAPTVASVRLAKHEGENRQR